VKNLNLEIPKKSKTIWANNFAISEVAFWVTIIIFFIENIWIDVVNRAHTTLFILVLIAFHTCSLFFAVFFLPSVKSKVVEHRE